MKSRSLILYWLILLAATVVTGLWIFRLLQHEEQRIAATRMAARQQSAQSVADDVRLIVEEAKDGLMARLDAAPAGDLPGYLTDLERSNPLVRNVYIWSRERGLILPDSAQGLTAEQQGFRQRYDRILTGDQSWPVTAPQEQAFSRPAKSSRMEVRQLASASPAGSGSRGWITWFWQDQLYLLGWVSTGDGTTRFGAELEMSALLSRLVTALPSPPAGEMYALLDANGFAFAQRGEVEVTPDLNPLAMASLGPTLPHWSFAIYETSGGPAIGNTSLGVAAGSIAGVLMLAILSAGSLLLWQARRSALEARQRTNFVSNVSHELKTPLTTIRMYSEMLAEGRVKEDAKRTQYLEVITRESERLTRLVNNVLDFSRLEQGRKQYRAERLDATSVLRLILEGQTDRLRESGLHLETILPEESVHVVCDRDALEQAVLNLLDNAVKYAAGGGRVRVELTRKDAQCMIVVEDAGPGIPAAQRAKLFQQFHRADDSLTAKTPGFGLGLSISRRLIEDHGGTLTFEPSSSNGARFTITLPCATEVTS